jgi:hypothetical protein
MSSNLAHDPVVQPENSDGVATHCLVLALIGIAALAIGVFMIPRDEVRPPATARGPAQVSASPAQAKAASASEPADKPFEYFPAQFGTPGGDMDEQPATF